MNLPTIQNKNRLAAIDDDNKDDFEERVPQKPRNIKRASSDEDDGQLQRIYKTKASDGHQPRSGSVATLPPTKNIGSAELSSIQSRKLKGQGSLPQVSSRSRKSPEEIDDSYNNKNLID